MTTSEFSYEFDVLYNNVTSNQAPGLNGYEKSVFLTKAEKQLVQEYYNQRTDVQGGGVDGSPKRQVDLSVLVTSVEIDPSSNLTGYVYVDKRALVFGKMQAKPVCILNESLDKYSTVGHELTFLNTYTVIPISYEEYQRLVSKPYKFPPKGMVWRLQNNGFTEIIGKGLEQNNQDYAWKYRVRYVRTPVPIIVESLVGLGVSIDGETTVNNCELPDEMHHEILERAVALAKIAWQGATMTQVAAAQK